MQANPVKLTKTLKFTDLKSGWILQGKKTATLRLFDDKDLKEGDELILINRNTGEVFMHATVTNIVNKNLGRINNEDMLGHEKYNSPEQMYEIMRKFYGPKVGPTTLAKIIRFKIHD